MRVCNKCGIEKEENTNNFFFRKDTNSFRKTCKVCKLNQDRIFRKNNIERYKKYERNPERMKSRNKRAKEHRINNLEETRLKQKEYIQKWKKNNPEKFTERNSKYYKNRSDEAYQKALKRGRILMKKIRATPEEKEANKIYSNNRRKSLIGNIKPKEWILMLKRCDYKCLKCLSIHSITIDHIYPVSKGGLNIIQNIQPLCLTCNLKKQTKIIDYRPLKIRQIYSMR